MQYTDVTDKTFKAIKRIIIDGKSLCPLLNGWMPVGDGFCLTDGYVTIYSEERLTDDVCRMNTDDFSNTIKEILDNITSAADDNIYAIDEPFATIKINTKLRGLCTKFQNTNRFGKSYIVFSGVNKNGERVSSSFNTRHLKNAFDCVGCSSEAVLVSNKNVLDGKPVLLIKPRLSTMFNRRAIVYPSADITGGALAS